MDVRIERETVKGGTVVRDARTKALVSVHTDRTDSYVDPDSRAVGREIADLRKDALERLLNR